MWKSMEIFPLVIPKLAARLLENKKTRSLAERQHAVCWANAEKSSRGNVLRCDYRSNSDEVMQQVGGAAIRVCMKIPNSARTHDLIWHVWIRGAQTPNGFDRGCCWLHARLCFCLSCTRFLLCLSLPLFMSTCPERTQCTMGNQFEIGHRESPWRSRTKRYPGPVTDAAAGTCSHQRARLCNLKTLVTLLMALSVPACLSATVATFLHGSSRQLSLDQPPLTSRWLSHRDNHARASMCAACIL